MLRTERTDTCYCGNCSCETSHDVVEEDDYEANFHQETWTCNCCGDKN